jgi:hypothetical protein
VRRLVVGPAGGRGEDAGAQQQRAGERAPPAPTRRNA